MPYSAPMLIRCGLVLAIRRHTRFPSFQVSLMFHGGAVVVNYAYDNCYTSYAPVTLTPPTCVTLARCTPVSSGISARHSDAIVRGLYVDRDGGHTRWCDGAMVRWCDGAMVRWLAWCCSPNAAGTLCPGRALRPARRCTAVTPTSSHHPKPTPTRFSPRAHVAQSARVAWYF